MNALKVFGIVFVIAVVLCLLPDWAAGELVWGTKLAGKHVADAVASGVIWGLVLAFLAGEGANESPHNEG